MGSILLLLSSLFAGGGFGLFAQGYVDYRLEKSQRSVVYRLSLGWIAFLIGIFLCFLSDTCAHMWSIVIIELISIALMGLIQLGSISSMKQDYGESYGLSKYWAAFFFLVYTLVVLSVSDHSSLNI